MKNKSIMALMSFQSLVVPIFGALEDSQVLAADDCIFEGRCKEISAFCRNSGSNKLYHTFVIIKKLMIHKSQQIFLDSNTAVTINISSEKVLNLQTVGSSSMIALCERLKSKSIDVIMCGDIISEDFLFFFAINGIKMVNFDKPSYELSVTCFLRSIGFPKRV
jgi:hypothetical protein